VIFINGVGDLFFAPAKRKSKQLLCLQHQWWKNFSSHIPTLEKLASGGALANWHYSCIKEDAE